MKLWSVKAHELVEAQARQLAEVLRDVDVEELPERPTGVTPAGDEQRLRGIPVVGARGVGGAIPGSRPGSRL